MSRFANLNADIDATRPKSKTKAAPQPAPVQEPAPQKFVAKNRIGKKGVAGFFSPELSRTLNIMAIEEGTTVQALMGEAFDLLMRARGKHPFGER